MSYVPAITDAVARAAVAETARRVVKASGLDIDLKDVVYGGLKRLTNPYVQKDKLNKSRATAKRIAERSFMKGAYLSPDSLARMARKKGTRRSKMTRYTTVGRAKETNYVDLAQNTYTVATNLPSDVYLLNTIPQGASSSNRIGKRVAMKSLQCRGAFYSSAGTTFEDGCLIIVYDRRPCGTMPNKTDIFTTSDSLGFNNDQNSDRFVVLKRVDYNLTGNIGGNIDGANSNSIISADFYLNLKGLPTVFKAAGTGAIGDQSVGSLFFMLMGRTSGAPASLATLSFRLRYVDI
jgi:hypothetical protein